MSILKIGSSGLQGSLRSADEQVLHMQRSTTRRLGDGRLATEDDREWCTVRKDQVSSRRKNPTDGPSFFAMRKGAGAVSTWVCQYVSNYSLLREWGEHGTNSTQVFVRVGHRPLSLSSQLNIARSIVRHHRRRLALTPILGGGRQSSPGVE